MTVTNGYATIEEFRQFVGDGITDHSSDAVLEGALAAASRKVDGLCGWRFWQDGSVVAREFRATDYDCVEIRDGISTTTGLIVKVDDDGDGAFETELTITTDYILWPFNAADDVPAWPYTEIFFVGRNAPIHSTGRPGIQVTAKFGWPAVPDDVKRATLLIAQDLWKAKDAPFGIAGANDFGVLRVRPNMEAMSLLAVYERASIG